MNVPPQDYGKQNRYKTLTNIAIIAFLFVVVFVAPYYITKDYMNKELDEYNKIHAGSNDVLITEIVDKKIGIKEFIENIYFVAQSLLVFQLFYLSTQLKADHDRSRRHMSISLFKDWSFDDKFVQIIVVKKLINALDDESKQKMMKAKEFKVDYKYLDRVKSCLTPVAKDYGYDIDDMFRTRKCNVKISECGATMLRQMIVTYFNRLECIFSAYQHNIADRDILREQFQYLASPEYNIEKILDTVGISHCYPGICFFLYDMKRKPNSGKEKAA